MAVEEEEKEAADMEVEEEALVVVEEEEAAADMEVEEGNDIAALRE